MESNSQTAMEGLIARCNESLQRGKDGGWASLTAYRDAGRALLELKEIVPRGQFGLVATERCGWPDEILKYFKPPEAAAYLKVLAWTLAKKRVYGDGPTFARWGKAIRYRREDLDAYMADRLVRSTTERPSSAAEVSAARSRLKEDKR
jgi:hypothetical protein